jgi:predicted transcriptional regulator
VISAITSWFLSQGLATLLGFAANMITQYVNTKRQEADIRENARLSENNRQLEEAVRVEHQLAEEAAKGVSEEDTQKRLEEGSA